MRHAFRLFPWMLTVLLALCWLSLAAEEITDPAQPEQPPELLDEAEFDVDDGDEVVDAEVEPDPDPLRDSLADYIDGVVLSLKRDHALGALTVSIVRDDGLWLARGYGLADIAEGRPVDPEQTLFRIGSVSKTFTWTAVKMLAERGQIDLDADLNDYLPQFQVKSAFREPVTMRQIMHHRGGFEDTLQLFAVADDDPRSLAELLEVHQPKRVFPPGARTSYSNWASALAALVVENVSGQNYGDFLQSELLDPLGMEFTTWLPPALMDSDTRARLATGYMRSQGALDIQGFMQIGAYWPAGGMASTATDMARWMRFHLNGGELDGVRLMDADTHARMWTRAYDDRPSAADVAHGFQDRIYHGLRVYGHGGGTAAFLTDMVMVPELSLGVFISQNSTHTASPFLHFSNLVIDRVAGLEPPPFALEHDEEGAEALEEFAGTYLGNRRVFSTFSALFGALGAASVTPLSANSLTVSAGGEVSHYQRLDGDIFQSAEGARITFLRAESGKVEALADGWGVHTAEKLGWFGNPNTLFSVLGLAIMLAVTHLLGFGRRLGRNVFSSFSARIAGAAAWLGVLSVLALVIAVVILATAMAEFDLSTMPEQYPHWAMSLVHYCGWAVVAAAGIMLLAHWPAWSGSGWGLVKRLHFGLFTLTLIFASVLLWHWRVIGAPVV